MWLLNYPKVQKWTCTKPPRGADSQKDVKKGIFVGTCYTVAEGLRFEYLGGYGTISCGDCDFSQDITSFTHGPSSSTAGYQCHTCGKFTTRTRKKPFRRPDPADRDKSLSELAPDARPSRIEDLQSSIRLGEREMQETPKRDWHPTWVSKVAECRRELSTVTEDELQNMEKKREEVAQAYEASLFCACGGGLERDKTLFCPSCRSNNLRYGHEHST